MAKVIFQLYSLPTNPDTTPLPLAEDTLILY